MNKNMLNRIILGLTFVLAGLNHFRQPRAYESIMPPYLPYPATLVALSGYGEVALGAMVLVPRLRRFAGWGLIGLLLAVFPANLNMAVNPERYQPIPAWALWLRLPLQAVLMAWVWWATRMNEEPRTKH